MSTMAPKMQICRVGRVCVVLGLTGLCGSLSAADGPDLDLARSLTQRVSEYRAEEQSEPAVLRLVYFHSSETEPLSDYAARWTRILDDIQSFYRDEMERNGFGALTFDYERGADGNPLIRVVKGRHPSSRYDYDTGRAIMDEVRSQLDGAYDIDKEFTLVVHGLCDELADGSYRFHAPYYGEGWSSSRGGVCHVADCPVLDPANLKDTTSRVRYVEHTGRFDQTTADFNTKYLGGVAHELGHGFGLPHNGETRSERKKYGPALMGGGNHTYRNDVWSDRPGTFLTTATCVQLAAHPLFVGRSKSTAIRPNVELLDGSFDDSSDPPVFRGHFSSEVKPIAVLIYADPKGRGDYDSLTAVAEVTDGAFACPLDFDALRDGELRIKACLINGGVFELYRSPLDTVEGKIDIQSIMARAAIRQVERAYAAGNQERMEELASRVLHDFSASRHVDVVREIRERGVAVEVTQLSNVVGKECRLGDIDWLDATVGWRKPARNAYPGNRGSEEAGFLEIDGQYFVTGLYAHAPSRYVFDLEGKWNTFETVIGFQDGGDSEAVWRVVGDGKELANSGPVGPDVRRELTASVVGVDRLELIVETTRPNNSQCWTIWAEPRLAR